MVRGRRRDTGALSMADDLGDKTEDPTDKRLGEARQDGNIAKSVDLSAALDLIGAALALWLLGGSLLGGSRLLMAELLGSAGDLRDSADIASVVIGAAWQGLRSAGPVMGVLAVIVVVAQLQQVGLHVTGKPLEPRLDRMDPIKGLGRLFSRKSLVKTGTGMVKLAAVGVAVGVAAMQNAEQIVRLPLLEAPAAYAAMGRILAEILAWMLALLLAIGVADWWYQKWEHRQELRMTKQQVKDEREENEGDPQFKQRRLQMARQWASQQAKKTVPTADVVVTNPTHYAVALRYDRATMAAPRVVAKGEDWMALRIRQIAAVHGVAIVERPPLARAIYAGSKVGQEVKPELYAAVAEVLAYVYRLKGAGPEQAAAG
ncbi:MAG: flagellar biosynthesis protein FlhB [Planctomyces sp.]|nr:flagellar biosynthesis protein FlhB [Planctomyces sp.]MBA4120446.1 flagellar biosynthesis protein FlhB [Isosphaera sp.]